MHKFKTLLSLTAIFIMFSIFFVFVLDLVETLNSKKITYFEYNVFNAPFKYIYFKSISEIEKSYYWAETNDLNKIALVESIYFNNTEFSTVLEYKDIYVK